MDCCSSGKKTDLYGEEISLEEALTLPWRTGTKVKRTIYARKLVNGWERLIGVLDSPELATLVVDEHNRSLEQS